MKFVLPLVLCAAIGSVARGQAKPDSRRDFPLLGDRSAFASFQCHDFDPLDGVEAKSFRTAFKSEDFFALDRSTHAQISEAWQLVKPLVQVGAPDAPRLWLVVYVYMRRDGRYWAEVAVHNDSIDDALGFQAGDFLLAGDDGRLLLQGKGLRLYDQTGCVFSVGRPFLAPDIEKLAVAMRGYTEAAIPWNYDFLLSLAHVPGRLDPQENTHDTGSGRNGYWDRLRNVIWNYWVLAPPEEPWQWGALNGLSRRVFQWGHEQVGCWSLDERVQSYVYLPGRPNNLYRYSEGKPVEPYDFQQLYTVDQDAPEPGVFDEGCIALRAYRTHPNPGEDVETFGRIHLPIVSRNRPLKEWPGSRINEWRWVDDRSILIEKRNGGDLEHFEVTRVATAALMGSEVAKLHLQSFLNVFLRRQGPKTAGEPESASYWSTYGDFWDHSSRTMGWYVQALLEGHLVTGRSVYWDAAVGVLDAWFDRDEFGRRKYEEVFGHQPIHHIDRRHYRGIRVDAESRCFTDEASSLPQLDAGTWIVISGFANPTNVGTFQVEESTPGSLRVVQDGLVDETLGDGGAATIVGASQVRSAFPICLTRERNNAGAVFRQGPPNWYPIFERPWQAAVSAMGFWRIFDRAEDEDVKSKARAAALEICDGIILGYFPGQGWINEYEINTDLDADGRPDSFQGVKQYIGTAHWCIDPVAKAYGETGDECYGTPALESWTVLQARPEGNVDFDKYSVYGHRMHGYTTRYLFPWTR